MLLDALEILLSGAYDDSEDDNPDDFSHHALMFADNAGQQQHNSTQFASVGVDDIISDGGLNSSTTFVESTAAIININNSSSSSSSFNRRTHLLELASMQSLVTKNKNKKGTRLVEEKTTVVKKRVSTKPSKKALEIQLRNYEKHFLEMNQQQQLLSVI